MPPDIVVLLVSHQALWYQGAETLNVVRCELIKDPLSTGGTERVTRVGIPVPEGGKYGEGIFVFLQEGSRTRRCQRLYIRDAASTVPSGFRSLDHIRHVQENSSRHQPKINLLRQNTRPCHLIPQHVSKSLLTLQLLEEETLSIPWECTNLTLQNLSWMSLAFLLHLYQTFRFYYFKASTNFD